MKVRNHEFFVFFFFFQNLEMDGRKLLYEFVSGTIRVYCKYGINARFISRGEWTRRSEIVEGQIYVNRLTLANCCLEYEWRVWPASALTPESTFLMFSRACHRFFDSILDYAEYQTSDPFTSLSSPWLGSRSISLLRSKWNCFKKKKKRGKKKRKNAHVIRTHRGGNDNCTVRTSMDEEHEVDFKVSLSKMLLTFLLKFTSNLISLSHDW